MYSNSRTTNSAQSNMIVKDMQGILMSGIGIIFLGIFAFLGMPALLIPISETFPEIIWVYVIYIALVITIFRLKAIWNGTVLDVEHDTIVFPGGGISANNFSDFFKLSYLLQYFKRTTIKISEINQISTDTKFSTFKDKNGIEREKASRYTLTCVGNFGSFTLIFASQGKRDQLYAGIRQVNEMGEAFMKV